MKRLLPVILIAVFTFTILAVPLTVTAGTITQDSQEKSGNITVGYNAGISYTVTIPASVTFSDTEKSVQRGLQVSNVLLNEGSTLNVNIASQNDFKMTYGEGYIEYSLLINSHEAPKGNNFTVLTVLAGEAAGWVILDFMTDLDKSHALYAGNYTDTLTFTVSIS